MTTITIPTKFGYPKFDMYINGKKYTLQSGVEITVEDHVAEVIEKSLALAPKYGRNISKFAQVAEGSLTEILKSDLEDIKNISAYAFVNTKSLKSIELPSSVTSIAYSAFAGCTNLKILDVGNSKLEKLSELAFSGCTSLESVKLPEIPPTLVNVSAFQNINTACIFYCKNQESLNKYKAATNWSTLTNTYTFKVESK